MRTLIDSIKARIAALTPYQVHFGEVEGTPRYPYILLWTSTGQLEQNTLAEDHDLSDRLGVTMVATTSEGVLSVASKIRPVLEGFEPESATWWMQAFRPPYDSQPIQIDRDVSLPNHGYPCFAVDLYRLNGTPK